MLTEIELYKLIKNGENSYVEFKEDTVKNVTLVKEMIALSNHKGGYILLGVSDNKEIVGLTRTDNEERIMNLCDDMIFPIIFPTYYETTIENKKIGSIEIEPGTNKPYCIPKGAEKNFDSDNIYIRQGSKTRKIRNRDELQRLFQASAQIHYEIIPVAYATIQDFDLNRANDFIKKNVQQLTAQRKDPEILLKNLDLLVQSEHGLKPTIAGMLLFGTERIKQLLPQSGITCIKIAGRVKTDEKLNYKFFNYDLFGNYEAAWNFIMNYNARSYSIQQTRRVDKFEYPPEVFRELIANACIHRDYTITGSEIFIWVFEDRVEICSPGSLPNTISVDKMKVGAKYHRNPILAQFFAYAGIVEMLGQGIPMVDSWLEKNGNPELEIEESENEVLVRVYKA